MCFLTGTKTSEQCCNNVVLTLWRRSSAVCRLGCPLLINYREKNFTYLNWRIFFLLFAIIPNLCMNFRCCIVFIIQSPTYLIHQKGTREFVFWKDLYLFVWNVLYGMQNYRQLGFYTLYFGRLACEGSWTFTFGDFLGPFYNKISLPSWFFFIIFNPYFSRLFEEKKSVRFTT